MAVTPSDMDADILVPDSRLASVGIPKHTSIPGGLGMTSLHDASKEGNVEVVQLLLDQGTDVNERSGHRQASALYVASFQGKLEVAKLLIKYGADVNCRDKEGFTPLLVASNHGHQDIAEFLLDYGADVNAQEQDLRSPLHFASWGNRLEMASLLLERGADVHARDINGRTPSELASRAGAPEIVQLLSVGTEPRGLKRKWYAIFLSLLVSLLSGVNAFPPSIVIPRQVNPRGRRQMRGMYLALRWMWPSLAMINPYRVTVSELSVGWTAERRVNGL